MAASARHGGVDALAVGPGGVVAIGISRVRPVSSIAMKTKPKSQPHKLGANQKEVARKVVKHDPNFKQSRDIREDRGERQMKTGAAPRTQHGK